MSLDHAVALFSASISFLGLLLVALQLRDSTRQRESEALIKLYDINRELLTLGFDHPILFQILEDKETDDPLWEKRYMQLWLNQLSLSHSFLRHAIVESELQEELHSNLVDFMGMQIMQKHWREYGSFYPASFQKRVSQILKKHEPPKAAHAKPA